MNVSSRDRLPNWAIVIHLLGAAAAVGLFISLFELGIYTSYSIWPTRYYLYRNFALRAKPLFINLVGAWIGAGFLILLGWIWMRQFDIPGDRGSLLKAYQRAAWPLHILWFFPLLYWLNFLPNLLWLFIFLAIVPISAFFLGFDWPSVNEKHEAKPSQSNSDETPSPVTLQVKLVLAASIACFILLFSILIILQYHAGNFGYADSGFVAEALYNTLRGQFLCARGFNTPMLLADHFSPIWLALLPFYALFPKHETLIVISSVLMSITAIPIFFWARWEWKDTGAALCLAIGFLLYPATQFGVYDFSYGFQAEDCAIPMLVGACYCLRRRYWRRFALFVFLTLCCKETLAATVVGIGICAWLVEKKRLIGITVAGVAILWFLVTTQIILPWLKAGGGYYQLDQFFGQQEGDHASALGNLASRLVRSPVATTRDLLHREVWMLVIHLLLPLSLLSLLSPASLLMGLPHFCMSLMSHKIQVFSIHRHYRNPLIIVCFFAAIVGVRRLIEGRHRLADFLKRCQPDGFSTLERGVLLRGIGFALVVAAFMNCYYFGPTPLSKKFDGGLYTITEHSLALARMKDRVPLESSLGCTQRAGAHFTDRRELYVLPLDPYLEGNIYSCDYILLDRKDRWGDPTKKLVPRILHALKNRTDFQLVTTDDGFMLFKKVDRVRLREP